MLFLLSVGANCTLDVRNRNSKWNMNIIQNLFNLFNEGLKHNFKWKSPKSLLIMVKTCNVVWENRRVPPQVKTIFCLRIQSCCLKECIGLIIKTQQMILRLEFIELRYLPQSEKIWLTNYIDSSYFLALRYPIIIFFFVWKNIRHI